MIRFISVLGLALFAALPARATVDIVPVTSPGGITAWLVEDHSIPFVSLEIRVRGGASLDLPGKRGATYLMTGLLEEGTGNMDAIAYAQRLEELAASFEFEAYDDAISISAQMLTENRDDAIAHLRGAVVSPSFSEDAIERVRAQVQSIIMGDANDPEDIASATFNQLAWGNHPYGSKREGTAESLAGLTRDDLIAAHQGALALDRVYVGASGDITGEELGLLRDGDVLVEVHYLSLDPYQWARRRSGAAVASRSSISKPHSLSLSLDIRAFFAMTRITFLRSS